MLVNFISQFTLHTEFQVSPNFFSTKRITPKSILFDWHSYHYALSLHHKRATKPTIFKCNIVSKYQCDDRESCSVVFITTIPQGLPCLTNIIRADSRAYKYAVPAMPFCRQQSTLAWCYYVLKLCSVAACVRRRGALQLYMACGEGRGVDD